MGLGPPHSSNPQHSDGAGHVIIEWLPVKLYFPSFPKRKHDKSNLSSQVKWGSAWVNSEELNSGQTNTKPVLFESWESGESIGTTLVLVALLQQELVESMLIHNWDTAVKSANSCDICSKAEPFESSDSHEYNGTTLVFLSSL